MRLAKDDHIVAAWAEHANIQVVVKNKHGLRMEVLSPADQSAEIHTLFTISEVVARTMRKAVERISKFSVVPR